jgi:hypothetical protein
MALALAVAYEAEAEKKRRAKEAGPRKKGWALGEAGPVPSPEQWATSLSEKDGTLAPEDDNPSALDGEDEDEAPVPEEFEDPTLGEDQDEAPVPDEFKDPSLDEEAVPRHRTMMTTRIGGTRMRTLCLGMVMMIQSQVTTMMTRQGMAVLHRANRTVSRKRTAMRMAMLRRLRTIIPQRRQKTPTPEAESGSTSLHDLATSPQEDDDSSQSAEDNTSQPNDIQAPHENDPTPPKDDNPSKTADDTPAKAEGGNTSPLLAGRCRA